MSYFRTWIGLATLSLLMAAVSGCVSQGTYDQTLQELQSTKGDLDRIRVQNEALNKQVRALKESQAKLQEDMEKAKSEADALNAMLIKERQATEPKIKDLERQVKELTASKKTLAQELEVQKQRNEDHLKTIRRQQKELKEREQSALLPPPAPAKPAAPEAPKPPAMPKADLGAAGPAGKPAPPPPQTSSKAPAPPKPLASLVDINKATAVDLTLNLGLGKDDTDRLMRNRPYKTKDELVTKAGIAKVTVDKIRDKITVGQ